MILLFGQELNPKKFPDNSLSMFNFPTFLVDDDKVAYGSQPLSTFDFTWKYEDDSEFFALYCYVNHLRENYGNDIKITLKMPYIYGARMDRVKNKKEEIFTLKWFAKFINSLNFYKVYVFDAHSDVSTALINNVEVNNFSLTEYINGALNNISYRETHEPVIYFPDAGAMKRYGGLNCFSKYTQIFGIKKRDSWKSGKVAEIKIYDKDSNLIQPDNDIVKDKPVLMVDDIISYGGTLSLSADELKKLGCGNIYAYASHVENSILDKEHSSLLKKLDDGTVKRIFTTNSIYNGKHNSIVAYTV